MQQFCRMVSVMTDMVRLLCLKTYIRYLWFQNHQLRILFQEYRCLRKVMLVLIALDIFKSGSKVFTQEELLLHVDNEAINFFK